MTIDPVTKVRLGSCLVGVGAGGFVTATVLHRLHRWLLLADGAAEGSDTSAELIAVAGILLRLGLWVAAVIGIGVLWSAAGRGALRLPGRAIAGWVLIGWGAVTAALGLSDSFIGDVRFWAGAAPAALGAGLAVTGWQVQRGAPHRPGPPEH